MRNAISAEEGGKCARLLSLRNKQNILPDLGTIELDVWKQKCQGFVRPFDQVLACQFKTVEHVLNRKWESGYEIQAFLVQYPLITIMIMMHSYYSKYP